jgi:hypothetical protein
MQRHACSEGVAFVVRASQKKAGWVPEGTAPAAVTMEPGR